MKPSVYISSAFPGFDSVFICLFNLLTTGPRCLLLFIIQVTFLSFGLLFQLFSYGFTHCRFAKPLEALKKTYASFLDRIRAIQKACLMKEVSWPEKEMIFFFFNLINSLSVNYTSKLNKTSLRQVIVISGSDKPVLQVDPGVLLECAKPIATAMNQMFFSL